MRWGATGRFRRCLVRIVGPEVSGAGAVAAGL